MHQRTAELNDANAFLGTVLGSVQAAVLVLDDASKVTVWNDVAADMWGLRSDEVLGHTLTGLDIGLKVDALNPMIRACLDGASDFEDAMLDAVNRRGKSIRCHVTCAPLRSAEGRVQE